jgi:hypothetical protein
MAYMLLILEDGEARRSRAATPEGDLAYERMMAFSRDLADRGICKLAEALKSDAEGVRITAQGGRRLIVDGPFAEAKEIVGGFFLLDCATREEALAIARECPAAEWATVEMRETGSCRDDAN